MSVELDRMAEEIAELAFRLVETERRVRNVMRYIEVTEVDTAKGLVKVVDRGGGEGKDLASDWLPWMEHASPQGGGNATTWRPPRVGMRGIWFSPSGNLAEGMIMPGGFSNRAGQPSQDGSAHVETNGKSSTTMTPDAIRTQTQKAEHGAGDSYVIRAPRVSINPAGGATS